MNKSISSFVKVLKEKDQLRICEKEVDPILELAEIQRRVVNKRGKAILFTNVKGSKFPVVTNLFGSNERIRLAFGKKPEQFIKQAVTLAKNMMAPKLSDLFKNRNLFYHLLKLGTKKTSKPPILSNKLNSLYELPTLKSWPLDGGRFITYPLVYTQSPKNHKGNLGMYRIQIFNENTTGMHIQIHRGGGFHYYEAEKLNQSLPAHIYVGGPPALTVSAIAPLPEEITEILLASFLEIEKIRTYKDSNISSLPILADADFMLVGEIPPFERKVEGPFGDHYGYYALEHEYPIFKVKHIFNRKDAIWAATVVGRPPQEDHWLAEYLQDLLSPIFPLVMPQVKSVWAYEESGVHSLAAAVVKERYDRESFMGALRILGEGQLSLTKFLMVTDVEIDLKNFRKLFITVLERADFKQDLFIFAKISQDSLDYTSPMKNRGSKAVLIGSGKKKNHLKDNISSSIKNSSFFSPKVYCPGVLVISGLKFKENDNLANKLLEEEICKGFQLVFLVDNSEETIKTDHDFIWHTFTRFDPARDIFSNYKIEYNQIAFEVPIIIDCRMKTWYPPIVEPDVKIEKQVNEKFSDFLKTVS